MAISNQPRSLIGLEKAINFLKQKINEPGVTPEFKAEAQRRIQIYSTQSSKLSSTAKKVVQSSINHQTGEFESSSDAELQRKLENKTVEFSDVGLDPTAAAGNSVKGAFATTLYIPFLYITIQHQ